MAQGSTQTLTEMNTRNISWGKGGRCVRLTTLPPSCVVVMKPGNLKAECDIYMTQPTLPSGRMQYIYDAVHVCSFSSLTVSTWAGNPKQSTASPTQRPGICQEPWCNLCPSGFHYYLCAGLTFGAQLREWQTRHIMPLFQAVTYNLEDGEMN